jgi:hypothetical protein
MQQTVPDKLSSFLQSKRIFRVIAVSLFFSLGAFAQFTTYLGNAGALPTLTGSTVVLQVRANHLATKVTVVSVFIKDSSPGADEFRINVDNVAKTLLIYDDRAAAKWTWLILSIAAGTYNVSRLSGLLTYS